MALAVKCCASSHSGVNMSRVAKNPVVVPSGVEVALATGEISIKGPMGTLQQALSGDVSVGRELGLVGVGYRAQAAGDTLNLTLGYSHPVSYKMPAGVKVETPTQTEIVLKGANRQQIGQVAAEIRAFREPEPYKGKGVRYSDEVVILKETKKKYT